MTAVPTLGSDRFVLRAPAPDDYPAYEAFMVSERSRYAGGPLTEPLAWRAFAVVLGHWQLRGFGMWTVADRASDTSIGLVGLWHPRAWPEQEIGWTVWPEAEGRGIAFEAAQMARAHAYGTLGWTTAVSYINPANARSIRLAERLGARLDPNAPRPIDNPCLVYRHPAPEGRP